MGITVRRAVESDLSWLLEQLKAFSQFFDTKTQLLEDDNKAHAEASLLTMIRDHVVFIAQSIDLTPLGFIAGWQTTHPFNPKIRVLSETFWWVPEEHRGSRAALMLFNAFKHWGLKHADWICMGLESHSPVNENCLTKRGFKLQERSFLMEVG